MKPWDQEITIDVPQDPLGTSRKEVKASIRSLVEHLSRVTANEREKILTKAILAIFAELDKPEKETPRPRRNPGGYFGLLNMMGDIDD